MVQLDRRALGSGLGRGPSRDSVITQRYDKRGPRYSDTLSDWCRDRQRLPYSAATDMALGRRLIRLMRGNLVAQTAGSRHAELDVLRPFTPAA